MLIVCKILSCSKSNRVATAEGNYRALRRLQLYITAVNVVNKGIIFSTKVNCLGMSITAGYAAIAHFSDHPIFGIMYYVVCIEASLLYSISYQKAFKVPHLIEKARMACKLSGQRLASRAQYRGIEKQLRSIPPVGIKVGEFHMLERTSTPLFLQYVLTNIVNMLVTFK